MAKRKLNKQQRGRIADQHSATLANTGDCLAGIVATHYGSEVEIVAVQDSGAVRTDTVYRCHLRANLPAVVCGDRVLWRPAENTEQTGVVEALEPRSSVINRPRPYSEPKPVAANIDLIVLVIAPSPAPIINLLDRYLIAAENAGIEAALLINKIDLLADPGAGDALLELQNLAALYASLGYRIYYYQAGDTRVEPSNKLGSVAKPFEVERVLSNKTSILVGQSGVGKSSIINKLCGRDLAATGHVSSANEKGRHTTTNAQLYFLQHTQSGVEAGVQEQARSGIIDSPGIREFALWHLSHDDIIDGMREFREYANRCRFRDCEHGVSAGCALQRAFDDGLIHPSRIASYRHIRDTPKN